MKIHLARRLVEMYLNLYPGPIYRCIHQHLFMCYGSFVLVLFAQITSGVYL